ncbi:hypothetical protein [Streptomyces sp. NPDC051572]|uniref:hypothetical protein n=1 Tax=Streptomyces sp. NPDC051572 TaxID=3155802 RepID=UPI00344F505F
MVRNPFHFTEGYGNPATPTGVAERTTITRDQGEPSWAVGGRHQVIRVIRLATDFWDRDTVHEQKCIAGLGRAGRWLDGTLSTDSPCSPPTRRAKPHPWTPTSAE